MKTFFAALVLSALAASCAFAASKGKALVAVFSKTGEQYAVGTISEGNTMIVARMIAEKTGADLFEIRTAKPYPEGYTVTTEIAKRELNANARPELAEDKDVKEYDTVFLGYPIWWGEPPMAVLTWLEAHDFAGKTVIPFATHEGSGMGRSERTLKKTLPGAKFGAPLALRGATAQNDRPAARKAVNGWLAKLGF